MTYKSFCFILLTISILLVGCIPNSRPTDHAKPTSTQADLERQIDLFSDTPSALIQTPSNTSDTRTANAIQPYSTGHRPSIVSIQMFNRNDGWAIAGEDLEDKHLLRTEDGGSAWFDVTPPETAGTIQEPKRILAYFLSPREAWAIFENSNQPSAGDQLLQVWSTSDGGITWLLSDPLDPASSLAALNELRFMEFVNARVGWLAVSHDPGVGQAPVSIYRTSNAGINWELVRKAFDHPGGNLDTCCQSDMSFLNEQTGVITNLYGPISVPFIDVTNDGGRTWQTVELPLPEQRFAEAGYCGTVSPAVLPPTTFHIVVQCLDPDRQTGASLAYLYSSTDSGITWRVKPLPDPYLEAGAWTSILRTVQLKFIDPLNGWAIINDQYRTSANEPDHTITHIFNTLDSGNSWEHQADLNWKGSVSFPDLAHGWAAVDILAQQHFSLITTDDNGQHWRELHPSVVRP